MAEQFNKQVMNQDPYGLNGLSMLWNKTKGETDVVIAVLDGPVDLKHECLTGAKLTSIDDDVNKEIHSLHGTFISSLIFANHASPVHGMAPGCQGLLKTIYHENNNGSLKGCSQSEIAEGVMRALEHKADIINISGGERLQDGTDIIPLLANALDECERRGVLVLAATGNEGDGHMHVPASYPTVLAVGSVKKDGSPSGFSNWTPGQRKHGVTLLGEDILGAIPGQSSSAYTTLQGTSFSTALLSGLVGLLVSLQKKQGMKKDPLTVRQVILDTLTPCSDKEGINCDRVLAGRLNLSAAIQQIEQVKSISTGASQLKSSIPVSEINKPSSINEMIYQPGDAALGVVNAASCSINPSEETTMSNETQSVPEVSAQENSPANEPQIATASADESSVQNITQVEASSATQEDNAMSDAQVSPSSTASIQANSASPSCECQGGVHTSSVEPSDSVYNPAHNQGSFANFENSQLVFAIGQPSYDFGNEARLDVFKAMMKTWYLGLPEEIQAELTDSPHDHKAMAAFLLYQQNGEYPNIFMSSRLIWLLNMNATPVYSITPTLSSFSQPIYLLLPQFLADNVGWDWKKYTQLTSNVEPGKKLTADSQALIKQIKTSFDEQKENSWDVARMSLPGYVSGSTKLMSRNTVQSVTPVAAGMHDWSLNSLIDSLPNDDIKPAELKSYKKQLGSILKRLYYESQNMGLSSDDRALNYSLYNIINIADIVKDAAKKSMQFQSCKITPSKLARQNSIVRNVELTFFDPANTTQASTTYALSVDVTDELAIHIGTVEEWQTPVSVMSV